MKTENDFNPYLEAIGKNISRMHQLREEKETTLAAAIGLSQAAVSRIVNGRYPSLKIMTLLRIAQHYKVDLTELLPPQILINKLINKILLPVIKHCPFSFFNLFCITTFAMRGNPGAQLGTSHAGSTRKAHQRVGNLNF